MQHLRRDLQGGTKRNTLESKIISLQEQHELDQAKLLSLEQENEILRMKYKQLSKVTESELPNFFPTQHSDLHSQPNNVLLSTECCDASKRIQELEDQIVLLSNENNRILESYERLLQGFQDTEKQLQRYMDRAYEESERSSQLERELMELKKLRTSDQERISELEHLNQQQTSGKDKGDSALTMEYPTAVSPTKQLPLLNQEYEALEEGQDDPALVPELESLFLKVFYALKAAKGICTQDINNNLGT